MNKIDLFFKSQVTTVNEKLSKNFSAPYFRDNVARTIIGLSFFLTVIAWIAAVFYFKISDYEVPVRYNSFTGVTQLGYWYDLYRFPFFLTITLVINVLLSKAIYKKNKLVSYMLTGTSIFLSVITISLIMNFGRLLGK